MKILYLHQYFTTPSMAGGTRSYEMARRLANAGHEVHIITSWRKTTNAKDWWTEQIDGITIHWLPVTYSNHMSFWPRIRAFIRFALGAARKAVSIGGDVIFATSTPLTIALPGVFAKRVLKKPMVFEVRDLWPLLPIAVGSLKSPILIWAARCLELFAYRNSDQIIALSPGMADGIAKTGYDRRSIHVIPNACDRTMFSPPEKDNTLFRRNHPELGDGPIILYAGTLGKINGVDYLADVANRLLQRLPNVRFVVIGAGAEEKRIREYAKELHVLNNNFFMYDQMCKTDLISAFHAAAVSTSLFINIEEMWSNSANKFFDGIAAGNVIAINYGGWQADLIEKYGFGILLGPDPEEASIRLYNALTHPESMYLKRQNSLKVAEELFDRDMLFSKFIKVLETV